MHYSSSHTGTIDLGLNVPAGQCCNCGTTKGLSIVDTPLKHTRYLMLGGTELTLTVPFPYCRGCAKTATRFRQGLFARALIAFIVFWIVLGMLLFVPGESMPHALVERLPETAGVLAVALTAGYFVLLRRAQPPQTSAFQPVSLAGLSRSFGGDLKRMTLRLTHTSYAAQFARANDALIGRGFLEVIRPR